MWTRYFQAVHLNDANKAAVWSGGIILSGGLVVLSYKASGWYLLPAVVGGAWGTKVAVQRGKPQTEASQEPASRVSNVQALEGQRCCN